MNEMIDERTEDESIRINLKIHEDNLKKYDSKDVMETERIYSKKSIYNGNG